MSTANNKSKQKDIIHFSHANGIPAKSYQVMLDALSEEFEVGYLLQLAHNNLFPVNDNWGNLVDELIAYMESHYDKPVIAVGHSMGGVVSYLAALKRPDLIKMLVLLDPPLLMGSTMAFMLRLAKRFNFIDKVTPAGRTLGRQEIWSDHDTAFTYFKSKSLFRGTDPRCLMDYVKHGTKKCDEGIRLTFTPQAEVAIFRTVPHNLYKRNISLKQPGAIIYGFGSDVVQGKTLEKMKRKVGLDMNGIEGGHMFPLERPEFTAQEIIKTISALSAAN